MLEQPPDRNAHDNVRRRTVTFGLAAALAMPHRPAWADERKITFVLVNDIYQMGDTLMADGKRRGGFARLAAVVKAERAKGGTRALRPCRRHAVALADVGLRPRRPHRRADQLIQPDIFVPGNHEFDFGKAIFLKRMAEAKFPLFAANLPGPDGKPLPGIKDREIVTFDGVRIGLTGAALDDTPRMSNPEDLKFLPTVATMKAQAEALRRDGADFVVAVMHADRRQGDDLGDTHAVDLILTGHDHDLFINFDGRTRWSNSTYDAHYVTAIDVHIEVKQQGNRREVDWWPQFRVIDTATVTPDPEVAAVVAGFEQELDREMDVPLATTAVELDSRNATVRTREAAIGNLIADAMRERSRPTPRS